jgi:anti-sigma regulatory factor (Ser/Thr protein kinase)
MRELSLHALDLLQNAVEAGARVVDVRVDEDLAADRLTMVVADDGRGMDADTARRALDPFFTTRTTRHVGLGLPLFAAAARRCDGDLAVESEPGRGTRVTATFRRSHVDRAPLGDMPGSLLAFLLGPGDNGTRLRYRHRVGDAVFEFDSAAVRDEVGDVPFAYPPLRDWLRDYIAEGEAGL